MISVEGGQMAVSRGHPSKREGVFRESVNICLAGALSPPGIMKFSPGWVVFVGNIRVH